MTREEFLEEKRTASSQRYAEKHKDFYSNPSVARIAPFPIADQLYYVGDRLVCIHLIDTGDGLVLLDSGYLGAEHLLIDSIWRLGFDPANVRWIIHSHGHSDHFGASSEFQKMFGTKLAISRIDAEMLRRRADKAIPKNVTPYAKLPVFDRELEDGEIFKVGNVEFRMVLTPGHTDGVLSIFFPVTYQGETYLAGMYGGAGVNAITLPYLYYTGMDLDAPQRMLDSIDKVWDEPVMVHLGNHPYNNNTLEKREKQLAEGGNPFIDSESWHAFLAGMKKKINIKIRDNEALEQKMKEMGI